MNYIEFEIGGKLRGFKFGLKFLNDILAHYDVDIIGLGEMMDKNPFGTRPTILYYGHVAHCKGKGTPVTFTEENVFDWVDEIPNGISNASIISAIQIVIESIRGHLPAVEGQEEEEGPKKK